MKFTKMHGAGNDYVYVNGFSYTGHNWSSISKRISDRHTGIGSDGLIIALPSSVADLRMQMFNADGSEGEMCGNGIRCLVGFAMSEGLIAKDNSIKNVETNSGVLTVEPIFTGNTMSEAIVNMGEPVLEPSLIPVQIDISSVPVLSHEMELCGISMELGFVSMGNPHAVLFIDDPVDDFPLESIGPIVENLSCFPDGINLEIANVVAFDQIRVRVWERGSGLTMACGTGACAVAVIAQLKGLVGNEVKLDMPGGRLNVKWNKNDSVMMRGPIEMTFRGEWDEF
jgi:diaminopimelate epimerase